MPLPVRTIILVYLLLFTLAIPWYLPQRYILLFGLPLWVTVSLLVSLCISLFTAWLLVTMKWPDE